MNKSGNILSNPTYNQTVEGKHSMFQEIQEKVNEAIWIDIGPTSGKTDSWPH